MSQSSFAGAARLARRSRPFRPGTITTALSSTLFTRTATPNRPLVAAALFLRDALAGAPSAISVAADSFLSRGAFAESQRRHSRLPQQRRLFSSGPETEEQQAVDGSDAKDDSLLFENLEGLHPVTKAALRAQGIATMTEVQAKTWTAAVQGQDVVGRSRTGSGKTLAFILPALERILRNQSQDNRKIQMLIVSPTRELAHQIYVAAKTLTSRFGKDSSSPAIGCQVCYGGIPKYQDIKQMERDMPTILTATPGRLLDLMESSHVSNVPFRDCVKDIQVLVLDEMDRLLDMGFRQDLQTVLRHLSRPTANRQRQTLLFSATVPPGVSQMVQLFVRPDHAVVDCIQDDDPSSHTVNTVDQSHVILPHDKLVTGVVQTILHLMKSDSNHKIIVFFPTTSQVAYFSTLFNSGLGRRVLEIHSRIQQSTRMNTSDRFRHAKTASVLFTSDVSARGVDYPNVTHVLQVGAASDRETYIHRLGRTGRAGKGGQGIVLLMQSETAYLRHDLSDIAIPPNDELQNLLAADPSDNSSELDEDMGRLQQMTQAGSKLEKRAEAVYSSLLGYYANRFKGLNVRNPGDALVEFVNAFAGQAGLKELPLVPARLAKQLGVDRHPALNIRREWDTGGRNFDVGGRQGGGGGDRFGGGGTFRGNYGSNQGGSTDAGKSGWAGWLK